MFRNRSIGRMLNYFFFHSFWEFFFKHFSKGIPMWLRNNQKLCYSSLYLEWLVLMILWLVPYSEKWWMKALRLETLMRYNNNCVIGFHRPFETGRREGNKSVYIYVLFIPNKSYNGTAVNIFCYYSCTYKRVTFAELLILLGTRQCSHGGSKCRMVL